jgi:hypothetical protein
VDEGLRRALADHSTAAASLTLFRAVREGFDPTIFSSWGGRWSIPNEASALYTSLREDGAIAELAFHWSQYTPRIQRRMAVHKLEVQVSKLITIARSDLSTLGIDPATYDSLDYRTCQPVGDACYRLGCDALRSPSARWNCDNVTLFNDHLDLEGRFDVSGAKLIDWVEWCRTNRPEYLGP